MYAAEVVCVSSRNPCVSPALLEAREQDQRAPPTPVSRPMAVGILQAAEDRLEKVRDAPLQANHWSGGGVLETRNKSLPSDNSGLSIRKGGLEIDPRQQKSTHNFTDGCIPVSINMEENQHDTCME